MIHFHFIMENMVCPKERTATNTFQDLSHPVQLEN